MDMQNPTGAANSSPQCSSLAPGGSVRTRSELQRLVTVATNPLEVKTELMDTLDPHTDNSSSANYDYNDDEVFCLSRQPVSGAGGSSSTSSGADTGTGNGTGGGPNSNGIGSFTNRTNIFRQILFTIRLFFRQNRTTTLLLWVTLAEVITRSGPRGRRRRACDS